MRTNTLSIRAFPYEVNKALKKKAIDQGISFRALVIRVLTEAAKSTKREA
jgi:predicted HicB family RNase H-like nuclease